MRAKLMGGTLKQNIDAYSLEGFNIKYFTIPLKGLLLPEKGRNLQNVLQAILATWQANSSLDHTVS